MGMDLVPRSVKANGGKAYCFKEVAWSQLLELALRGGWIPAGTCMQERDRNGVPIDGSWCDPAWDGRYDSNDYQFVTAEDAMNLAAALEQILPDLPDHDALGHKTHTVTSSFGTVVRMTDSRPPVNPYERFSGAGKRSLVRFIEFCRQCDGFWIY